MHRVDDERRGGSPITTWEEFKVELKKQFYPENAGKEARAKLRRLQHKEGCLREYIKEFQELLLEITSMGEKDALFTFLDRLSNWAQLEMSGRGVQDLAAAIAVVETLTEFRREKDSKS